MADYLLVKKSFRCSDPKKPDYMSTKDYYQMMYDKHGLCIDTFGYHGTSNFEIDCIHSAFMVVDKGKSMIFAMMYSEFVDKPYH